MKLSESSGTPRVGFAIEGTAACAPAGCACPSTGAEAGDAAAAAAALSFA